MTKTIGLAHGNELKVYVDNGAYVNKLKELVTNDLIELIQFKYENKNKRISHDGLPGGEATFEDLKNYTYEMLGDLTYGDFAKSDKYDDIRRIVGKQDSQRMDAMHLDSAYKSNCKVFLTTDKDDIWNKRKELECLLSIKIYLPIDEWDDFKNYVFCFHEECRNELKSNTAEIIR